MSAHTELGAWGEAYVAARLADVAPVEPAQRADLRWMGLEIEVKTARAIRRGDGKGRARWHFCLRRAGHTEQRGDVVVLVLAETGRCYVIPATALRGQRIVCIGHQTGQFTEYAERWELLADLVEAAHVSL